jgi:hypothetical protein
MQSLQKSPRICDPNTQGTCKGSPISQLEFDCSIYRRDFATASMRGTRRGVTIRQLRFSSTRVQYTRFSSCFNDRRDFTSASSRGTRRRLPISQLQFCCYGSVRCDFATASTRVTLKVLSLIQLRLSSSKDHRDCVTSGARGTRKGLPISQLRFG